MGVRKMANGNIDQTINGYVSFVTSSDEACIRSGGSDVPALVVHAQADAETLWGVAEARLMSLDKLLLMFADGTGTGFGMADFSEVVRPRVQEILSLASTGNARASMTRSA
jgi:hypothetical protein